MAIFLRFTAVALYLALIALGFWLVHIYRDDKAIATGLLVLWGCAPIVVGFALAWGGFRVGGPTRLPALPTVRALRSARCLHVPDLRVQLVPPARAYFVNAAALLARYCAGDVAGERGDHPPDL